MCITTSPFVCLLLYAYNYEPQRKYVRENPLEAKVPRQMYNNFEKWLAVKYTEWRYPRPKKKWVVFSATQLAVLIAARCYYASPDRQAMEERGSMDMQH